MKTRKVSLGSAQVALWHSLCAKGHWHDGCGWTWDTYSKTTRLLDSLVKAGFAEKVVEPFYNDKDAMTVYRPIQYWIIRANGYIVWEGYYTSAAAAQAAYRAELGEEALGYDAVDPTWMLDLELSTLKG